MGREDDIIKALQQLDAIGNAPMTASERVKRATPELTSRSLGAADIATALGQRDLPWNETKQNELGLDADQWQAALKTAQMSQVTDIGGLMDAIHRAEAAAPMLKAGYSPSSNANGKLTWTR